MYRSQSARLWRSCSYKSRDQTAPVTVPSWLQHRIHRPLRACGTGLQISRDLHSDDRGDSVRRDFKRQLSFPQATHEIHQLQDLSFSEPSQVVLHGYLGTQNVLSKKLCFAPLFSRDLDFNIQLVSAVNKATESKLLAHARLLELRPNSPVVVSGTLRQRSVPPKTAAGEPIKIATYELDIESIRSLNEFPEDIIMTPETVFPPQQRHLQLRQERPLRDALRLRSAVGKVCRDFLANESFTEIETPILFKPTPEGAREFIVPTRRPGLAYALPQSPQQYKQILMSSGISRYYQISRCFRDEDLRADRQPEFTQLDLEMSFASGEDVMRLIESLIQTIWATTLGITLPAEFPQLKYQDAMKRFGSDKPDMRFGVEISRLDYVLPVDLISKISGLTLPIVEGLMLPLSTSDTDPSTTRRFISEVLDSPEAQSFHQNPHGGPGVFIYDSSKPLDGLQAFGFEAAEEIERRFEPCDGDLLILQARPEAEAIGGSTMLGNLRLMLHRTAVEKGLLPAPSGFAPLWVTDFPLFSPITDSEPGQGGSAGLAATHHPFTSPKTGDDVDLLATDPTKAVADHYDLVINGVELGGGSRRVHHADMQRHILEDILKMSPERVAEFGHLLEALRAGCPPHAGIALGFDRLIAMLAGRESIRDVIAFPKTNRGEDVLVHSPSRISDDTLNLYHMNLKT